jgi:hypothetical protein
MEFTKNLDSYVQAQLQNWSQTRRLPHVAEVIIPLDELYQVSRNLIPPSSPPTYGRFLLLCHKAFLAAATTIGRCQPDDAAGVTRRAIEIATIAAAMKADPANVDKWLAFEERMARWAERDRGERPRPFHPDIRFPSAPLVERLRAHLGMLSDASVHFTPEYLDSQRWWIEDKGAPTVTLYLPYFTGDQRTIEREFLFLGTVHADVLDLFDECFDGVFHRDSEWLRRRGAIEKRGRELSELFRKDTDEGR